jgi:Rrf2 family protein
VLSNTSEYALRAVLHLAMYGGEGPLKIEQLAAALGLPRNYLSKTLHQLARVGVLSSGRGKHGGFQLGVPAEELSLARVVEPFEPMTTLARHCLLGMGRCSDETACPAHHRWKVIAEPMRAFFETTTVADLVEGEASLPGGVAVGGD